MSARRAAVALLGIVSGALLLRAAVMQGTFPVRMLGDERYYVNTAINIAQGRGHVFKRSSRLWRPPAHAWLLSRFVDLEAAGELDERGDPTDSRRLWRVVHRLLRVEVVLSALVVAATGLLGWALFDARVALAAAGLAAVYPNLVAFGHYLWSESLFTALAIGALAAVAGSGRRREPAPWALAAGVGAVFGAAALTREIAIPLAGIAALWWVARAPAGERGAACARGALLCAVAAAVVAPWSLRNYSLTGRFVPVSSIGWFAAAQGNVLESRDWRLADGPEHVAFERTYFAVPGEIERMDYARAQTFERIADEQPAWLAKKLVHNLTLLFTPDSYVLYKIRRGAYGELGPQARAAVTAAVSGSYVLVLALGALGFALAPPDGRRFGARWLCGGAVAAAVAVHVFANADTRFRLPWMPVAIVYAALVLVYPARARSRASLRALAPAAAALAFLFAVCVPYFVEYGGRR